MAMRNIHKKIEIVGAGMLKGKMSPASWVNKKLQTDVYWGKPMLLYWGVWRISWLSPGVPHLAMALPDPVRAMVAPS